MRSGKITSIDVAARAGVSQSAVSRVFTPGASASKETAEKVRKAAAELGYRPNVLARSLITGRSRIIGLVVAYLQNQFYLDALERLSAALETEGYRLMVFLAADADPDLDRVVDELLDYQVDGIIAASVGLSDSLVTRCDAAGIPVVLFNRSHDDRRFSQIVSDNAQGAAEVARFLVAGGHRRIAQITGLAGSNTGRDRAEGFCAGLSQSGVPLHASGTGQYCRTAAREVTLALWDRPDPPDAVFVGNDHMAFAVMDTLRSELGLSVPGDVSVVGYDDVPLASWGAYDLTTWRQPSDRMVVETVACLLRRVRDPDAQPRTIIVPGQLVLRGSAQVPEGWAGREIGPGTGNGAGTGAIQ
ncbi:MAG: LacI family DNA-binding transcriptional regulator [Rhodobacteraceae bacterium]|nr:LacI family DNA-binding transcriptional regulator [Paracoccaceae bacterium]